MNKAPLILAGIFAALFLSWYGMVWGPASQQSELTSADSAYPHDRVGLAKQGAQVYRENGCYHCHSQQVRQGKVLYDIRLTGLGDDKQALKDMMKRNGLEYDSYKDPIDKAYLFKDPGFVQWLTGQEPHQQTGYLPTLEKLEVMAQSLEKELNDVQEGNATLQVLLNKLADPVAFLEKLSGDQNIDSSTEENMRKAGESMSGEMKKAFSKENIDAIAGYAGSENLAGFIGNRNKVKPDNRLLIAKLSGLLSENAKAANAFFGLSTGQRKSGAKALPDSISLFPDKHIPWSSLDVEQDAKRLLAAIKGVGCTANTRSYMPDGTNDPLWSDLQHNWGERRSVPADYLYDSPVMIGIQRLGPDLADIGRRQREEKWHYRHLYRPRDVDKSKKSIMPPYPYLFERRGVANEHTETELVANHPDGFVVEDDDGKRSFITPKPAARVLVAYLLSLEQKNLVPEAPAPVMEHVAKKETDGGRGSQ